MAAIEIKTRLHDGVTGGGVTHTFGYRIVSARTLLRAAREAREIHASNYRSFGNLGCGRTWIEVNGVRLTWDVDWIKTVSDARCALADTEMLGVRMSEHS